MRESFHVIAPWIVTAAATAALVGAWWTPGSELCAALGWTSTALWCAALSEPRHRLKRMFAFGVATYVSGFYWLYETIASFGGFPFVAAIAIFALFAFGSAFQFVIWGFLWRLCPRMLARLGLRGAVCWLIAQHFWIRIFPWDFGHTQIGFLPFAQIADIGGVWLITFVMLWASECLLKSNTVALAARLSALGAVAASIVYGFVTAPFIENLPANPLPIVLVQGNVSLEHKHDVTYFTVNRERYLEMSKDVARENMLVVWPESTITDFVRADVEDARYSPLLPFLGDGSAFLVGALTYNQRREMFNSSVLVRPDGTIAKPYNKIVLMPFGEYTPFGSWLPFLKEINATAGQFTAGSDVQLMSFPLSNKTTVNLSSLICYEDILPRLAARAAAGGAELLVNQTNDAWFGDTAAPHQHHMIASFRAIENRRYLLRSTNTGLTAVVDPLGRTIAALPTFTEGTLQTEVNLIRYRSFYSIWPIEDLWLVVAGALLCWILLLGRKTLSDRSE